MIRPKELYDNAVPSGNSAAAEVLQRMALLTGAKSSSRPASPPIRLVRNVLGRAPTGFGHALSALDLYLGPSHEVAIIGSRRRSRRQRLCADEVLTVRFLPEHRRRDRWPRRRRGGRGRRAAPGTTAGSTGFRPPTSAGDSRAGCRSPARRSSPTSCSNSWLTGSSSSERTDLCQPRRSTHEQGLLHRPTDPRSRTADRRELRRSRERHRRNGTTRVTGRRSRPRCTRARSSTA